MDENFKIIKNSDQNYTLKSKSIASVKSRLINKCLNYLILILKTF